MSKIILYHPKTFHENNYRFYWIPYSILSIASYLHKENHDILIVDNNLDISDSEYTTILENIKEATIIGISCFIGKQITDGLEFAKKAKTINGNIKIIWGGYAPTLLPELFMENDYVDYLVKGPNEKEFCELVEHICNGKKINHMKTEFVINDRPPYPFSLLNIEEYVNSDPEISNRTINYISSQGCPFQCGFCSDVSMYQSKQYSMDRDRIMSDIILLCNNYNINGVKLYDSNFFSLKQRVINFANDLYKYNPEMKWAASAHPNNLIILSSNEWNLIKKSGCTRILIGAESGCQNVLNMIRKHTTIHNIREVAKRLAEYDIIGSFTFIVGFPGESDDVIDKTIEFGNELLAFHSSFEAKIHFYLPYPGTPMYDRAISFGFQPPTSLEEWAVYDYYKNEMPWVRESHYNKINKFNKENCPYVSDN